ncbi:P-loop containing nucleoside triphosphate hydrolase protein [Pseudovirgaria hyperparasitica]|uniref:RNA helicase n=1 Tax=Pseudovirgaria hyperparasitica TaxID=470096 RepID=A0A6A6W953_9PEZI|nr:P-loop containing nucleoside triphosphate hydrolase protein [Pseudovirgaria hyperparasitica]KAF2757621.1 P-loop containing nucleoside triphosphate hydrolase protein [Pseudovirgaria hyperparasitica]
MSAEIPTESAPVATASEAPKSDISAAQTDGAFAAPGGDYIQDPEWDVQVKLKDLQADPNNPLYSIKSFNELQLAEPLVKGLVKLSFRKPSKIQERALPLLLRDPPTNLIAQSQSGTGKTAAFVLNMLSRVKLDTITPQALVLAPTRELAVQIRQVIQSMGEFLPGLVVQNIIPDPSKKGIKYEAHILVGTPGSVVETIKRKLLDTRQIGILVLDEADNMLDMQGMGDQCKRVKVALPHKPLQVVLFSATFPEEVMKYANQFAPNADEITLKPSQTVVKGIRQLYLDCNNLQEKFDTLLKFYGLMTIASSIIYVRTRATSASLAQRMISEGHAVVQLSGELEGHERDAVMEKFRSGEAKVLITTNVLSRGIDVQSVTMVINYDIPEDKDGRPDPETYYHRIGRTGRFGRVGVAISFVHDKDSWDRLYAIAKHFDMELHLLNTDDWDKVEDEVSNMIKHNRAGASIETMQKEGTAGAS